MASDARIPREEPVVLKRSRKLNEVVRAWTSAKNWTTPDQQAVPRMPICHSNLGKATTGTSSTGRGVEGPFQQGWPSSTISLASSGQVENAGSRTEAAQAKSSVLREGTREKPVSGVRLGSSNLQGGTGNTPSSAGPWDSSVQENAGSMPASARHPEPSTRPEGISILPRMPIGARLPNMPCTLVFGDPDSSIRSAPTGFATHPESTVRREMRAARPMPYPQVNRPRLRRVNVPRYAMQVPSRSPYTDQVTAQSTGHAFGPLRVAQAVAAPVGSSSASATSGPTGSASTSNASEPASSSSASASTPSTSIPMVLNIFELPRAEDSGGYDHMADLEGIAVNVQGRRGKLREVTLNLQLGSALEEALPEKMFVIQYDDSMAPTPPPGSTGPSA
ncbi:hypothetical protein BKA93DRAFT_826710 [Sparassis latifolia]